MRTRRVLLIVPTNSLSSLDCSGPGSALTVCALSAINIAKHKVILLIMCFMSVVLVICFNPQARWIVILLIRREKFLSAFGSDLFSKHRFGSFSQTFLQNRTWSFGCSDVSGVIKI